MWYECNLSGAKIHVDADISPPDECGSGQPIPMHIDIDTVLILGMDVTRYLTRCELRDIESQIQRYIDDERVQSVVDDYLERCY